ncbi:MAG: phosphate ABC transporter permease PstA [Phenylobacterium sp.]|jgi:phosphate transport system permease protein|uniref:phosphate ABC transporter permease PstA n=1 Tax=unclassified Phenylobacterium TaxID=2640670 RepID=UPI0008ACD098|nr:MULTISPECIES: phosphate ABC transporter permease PstA [unclassified Phenylobacterium]MBJ7411106.1 phosphate ABC transporter permease PstA [Phenylobacterium sp.]OHB26713.1 MAG: phosphate ABC transporter, permease protein PstA [Phenylobacterium sp. RIFCSPHIGHO2_01_FULL_69_31]
MSDIAIRAGDDTRRLVQVKRRQDLIFGVVGILVLFVVMGLLMTLVADLLIDGLGRISPEFLTSFPSRRAAAAGVLSAWVGTTLVMLVTAAIAIPLGVGAGLYLEEYASKNLLSDIIEVNVSNLAGVPSIIYGLLALGFFVYALDMGQTILVGGLVLSLLILPIVIVATREAVRAIPSGLRESAYGIGANRWQVMWSYILPSARPGILTGAIVGLSRAIGETAPIITIGALTYIAFLPPAPVTSTPPWINFEWLNSPFTVMPIQMFNWTSRPQAEFHVNAAATGVLLLCMTLMMNGFAIYLRYRLRRTVRT